MQEKIKTRTVDTTTYMDVLKELVNEGREVPLLIAGNSMSPFLIDKRDTILISPIKEPLRVGDMAFFQRASGQYVMHRIQYIRKNKETGTEEYYFLGDAQYLTEGPIPREQIFGLITKVCRKDKWIEPGNFWWEFFRRIWLKIVPFRRVILRSYAIIVGRCKKK
ncbi:MAG: S24/S26 family peptidase [Ruminococcus sp.]|nr:S24/S26 family peptidase [Ruminococcus sp.]